MGEYARKGKESVRLGTCEDLMYVTQDDVEALCAQGWEGDGGMKNLRRYLDCKAVRFALPRLYDIPGDVNTIESRKPDFEHRYTITIDAATADLLRDVDHSDICLNQAGTNFFIPCPMGNKPGNVRNSGVHARIDLVAIGGGNGRAVYQCPYCRTKFNLAGHAAQYAVLRAFENMWCAGASKLDERTQAKLVTAICWTPEPEPTAV
jgi:hypothetical protein